MLNHEGHEENIYLFNHIILQNTQINHKSKIKIKTMEHGEHGVNSYLSDEFI